MTEMTQPMDARVSLWRRVWAAIRDEPVAATVAAVDASVSFPELVWAHHERQREVYREVLDGPWEREYRRRLAAFKREHGEIKEAYWCRYAASGIAITAKPLPRRASKLFAKDEIQRIHTATDWRTRNAPTIASWLHRWETVAIKASEVLRETSERIALNWIFAASSRLLACVDRDPRAHAATDAALKPVLADQQRELDAVSDYYQRAGENSARIVYFKGMALGTVVLAAVVGGGFFGAWAVGWLDPHDAPTYTAFVTIAMGAAGAILSVMTRMARRGAISLEFEVGRKSMRFLGGLRPWIGALFALALYLALKSSLLEILPTQAPHGVYYFATIGFVAGFSERRAKVLLDSVGGTPSGGGSRQSHESADDDG
jgi:hypothetical protein